MMRRAAFFALAAGLSALVAGCAPGQEDLRQWMTEQRNQMRPQVTPLAEPKKYVPKTMWKAPLPIPSARIGSPRLCEANPACGVRMPH